MHAPERAGLLMVSVWIEGDPPDRLLARVTAISDVFEAGRRESVAGSIEEVLDIVRAWMTEVVTDGSGPPQPVSRP